ncbi:MAG TPA: SUMF1/EgtB/PvdO family nonheme iron enzyme [Bryobacteraceae bacterium]
MFLSCFLVTALLAAAQSQSGRTSNTNSIKVNPQEGLKYVWIPAFIPAGKFMMGCSPGDECPNDEKAHRVAITKGFWFGQTPVTQRAYERVMQEGLHRVARQSGFKGANLPVDSVNWVEARSYCYAIAGCLPTEAEWEYAARAGSTGMRYGDPDKIAWYEGNSDDRTHEVGQKQPNAFRLYDMLGNVREWVADWYGPYRQGAQIDPYGDARDPFPVVRGAPWYQGDFAVRVSKRDFLWLDNWTFNLGIGDPDWDWIWVSMRPTLMNALNDSASVFTGNVPG